MPTRILCTRTRPPKARHLGILRLTHASGLSSSLHRDSLCLLLAAGTNCRANSTCLPR